MKKTIVKKVLLLLLIQLALINNPWIVKAEPLKNTENSTIDNDSNQSVSDYLSDTQNPQDSNESTENIDSSSVVDMDKTQEVGISIWDFIKALMAFLFVIGLLLFLLKFISKKSRTYNKTKTLDNLGGISLGNHKSIQLVKVGERILIIGVGENIQLLKEIEEEEEYNKIIESFNASMDQLATPSDIVTKVMNFTKSKLDNKKIVTKDNETDTSFKNMLNVQLNEMKISRQKTLDELNQKGTDK